tara:strand:+ start:1225 stop:1548 length:324 start_codon:yes stop_codon:yes gene_type:complete
MDIFQIKPENLDEVIKLSEDVFNTAVKESGEDYYKHEEQWTEGFEVGDQIIDINVWDGEKLAEDGYWHCEVIECFDRDGFHCRGDRSMNLWSIKKGNSFKQRENEYE